MADQHAKHTTKRRIGAHLSAAGGYERALTRAQEINATALQIFSASPRVWARPTLDEGKLAQIAAFARAAQAQDIRPIFVHALYLINLASENKESVQKSQKAILFDLEFGKYINCAGVVVHLGSHQGRGWTAVRESVALTITALLRQTNSPTPLLIENSAGQKGKLCSDLGEIRWLLDAVDDPRLGWCYDTCHGWAAGYTPDSLASAIRDFNLADTLRGVHVNDSRDARGSGRDRHANIGEGQIGHDELAALINLPALRPQPLITEAPGFAGLGPDAENIARLQALVQN